MPNLATIEDLLIHVIKDLYSAEIQLLGALPRMAGIASDAALAEAISNHLEETKGHVFRLENVAGILGISPHGVTCLGMKGLIAEAQEMIRVDGDPAVRDLALTGAARRVEHYEIAGYRASRELAEALGRQDVVALLQETEDEEKSSEKLLMALAAKVAGGAPAGADHLS